LRLACRLPAHHRATLREGWLHQTANPNNHVKVRLLTCSKRTRKLSQSGQCENLLRNSPVTL
jgi:hypothetical protein